MTDKKRILSLSGGGYLGLYTAKILEETEALSGRPIADSFTLIAGTSVGGIIALGLAAGRSAKSIREAFQDFGPKLFGSMPRRTGRVHSALVTARCMLRPKFESTRLRQLIEEILGSTMRIGDLRTSVAIPAVNLSTGRPCVFKTPHHPHLTRDARLTLTDVALATSAAPTYFSAHSIGGEIYADGGLFANAPDDVALIEAEYYLGIPIENINLLSIATPTRRISISNRTSRNMGILSWLKEDRLSSTMLASQQLNVSAMLKMRLGERYFRITEDIPSAMEATISFDCASSEAQSDLLALAEASFRRSAPRLTQERFLR